MSYCPQPLKTFKDDVIRDEALLKSCVFKTRVAGPLTDNQPLLLNIKPKQHHVTVLDGIIFAFLTHLPGLFNSFF